MTARAAFMKWFGIGALLAVLFVAAQAVAVGGLGGLLQVGQTSDLRPLIEEQLGQIPLAPGPGHDGQIYYAIGLDLIGDEVPELLDHGAYRYRRILYPAVASAFGLLGGWPLLYGMITLTVISTALASGLTAATAVRLGRSDWFALAILANPGIWLSIRLLTADIVALGLMSAGLWYVATGENRLKTPMSFALSALAKDVYIVTPAGLAIDDVKRRWRLAAIPALVLAAWMTWLTMTMGEGFTGRGNLALPFVGIVDAAPVWTSFDAEEWLYLLFALISVAVGLVAGLFGRSWLRWPILGWSLLAIVSSNWVWDLGNNAARAFAPIALLVVLSYVPVASTPMEVAVDVLEEG